MPNITATFFGESGSGKTALIEQFTQRTVPEDESGVVYNIARVESTKIQLWDLSGKHPNLANNARIYLADCNVCVYTIDLTSPFNKEQFLAHLEIIKGSAPNTSLILVGCKSDLPRKIDHLSFQRIMEEYNIPYGFITSSATGEGVNQLFSAIAKSGNYQKVRAYVSSQARKFSASEPTLADLKILIHPISPLYGAIENLEQLATELAITQQSMIKEALIELLIGLNDSEKNKEDIIKAFVLKCEVALKQASDLGISKTTLSQISKGVLVVAVASTLAAFVASSIFSLGITTLFIAGLVGTGVGAHLVKSGFFKSPLSYAVEQIQTAAQDKNMFIEQPVEQPILVL
ncbi:MULTISPECIES: ADP-ribosylation factor-like protein [Legionella]|uniref:Rho GTPase (Miro-like) n=1 Tax=Legionella maceachernii TaxID=466 RepID=A0A0W0WI15_9GAMM|nr:ADP-ribosylation factor-like protein [Legionella maceachernii]KTD31993.1 Rho GTPase (Miro-like) [Legionella maceachernii]SKA24401.1 small GTP-binding protein domain-containing protein [Legionella maceachernii]SUP04292.1 small GTP-binding protein domain [Legionella maceachernii]